MNEEYLRRCRDPYTDLLWAYLLFVSVSESIIRCFTLVLIVMMNGSCANRETRVSIYVFGQAVGLLIDENLNFCVFT